ncbi:hypothetical protein P7F88_25300 [Vibrio hannami]|uniref:hypothetical protein n=1 Tax=Vibrio hannami TaxID=2717094 RepID=UPI0024108AE3|nr:hypothetical protein [Vibrio hannami]MDG3089182.1 hypothetical protein [Vibrio hannami]
MTAKGKIMNRNYRHQTLHPNGLTARTDMVVAVAIHAIADGKRTAEQIWEAPTANEWDHVCMAVEEYIRHGDFDADERLLLG